MDINIEVTEDAIEYLKGLLETVDIHRMPRTSKPSYLIQHPFTPALKSGCHV